jgi:cysteine desulfurase family protein (TIGR01976 family)
MTAFDPQPLRAQFPALARHQAGREVVYLDGPGGTQVPERVIDAVSRYYREMNANDGGAFVTSQLSDETVAMAHAAVADLVGAASADEIKFGANMTTLTFHVSRAITAAFAPGDEIVVTTLDHEANVSPWHAAARDHGLTVRTVAIREDDCTLDLEDLESKLGPRTKLVAIGYASNAVGTINPVKQIVDRAHAVGAWTYVDAVHYAPHGPIDVRDLGTDFLVTSAYKWFGPHQGALYGRREVLDQLPAYKVRPAHDRFETGTQAFELITGILAAVEYLRDVGRRFGEANSAAPEASERRRELVAAMNAIAAYERTLAERMIAGLGDIDRLRVWGMTDPGAFDRRTPTFAVTIAGITPREAAVRLGRAGIFAWDGDFYAQALIEQLGLFERGGVLRLGLVHYNTADEVDRVLEELRSITRTGGAADATLEARASAPVA